MYGKLAYVINQYVCAIEVMYLTLPVNVLLNGNIFLFVFLIGSQSEVVSTKFLFFVFLLNYNFAIYLRQDSE